MGNNIFNGMQLFCSIVDTGSFSGAAKKLGHSASHVSKEIARLEDRLGSRLMNRTTRSFSLTETGRMFYDHARQIVEDAKSIEDFIQTLGSKPFGHLRISVPVMVAQAHFNDWLARFLALYPDITCEVEVSDRKVNVVAEGYDMVIRAGQMEDADLVAKELFKTAGITVAAPDYLARHGTPTTPQELPEHTLIDFSYRPLSSGWEFKGKDGKPLIVNFSPRVRCNSAETEAALAIAGTGITRLPQMACAAALEKGQLVRILAKYDTQHLGIYAVYPSRSHLAPKVRALIDFLNDRSRPLRNP